MEEMPFSRDLDRNQRSPRVRIVPGENVDALDDRKETDLQDVCAVPQCDKTVRIRLLGGNTCREAMLPLGPLGYFNSHRRQTLELVSQKDQI
jgi:hypothetical protein